MVLQPSRYADGAVLPQPPWLAVGLVSGVPDADGMPLFQSLPGKSPEHADDPPF